MSFLRNWIVHNWHLKLLALAVSFLLWAGYTSEPFVEVGYNVPVFFDVPEQLEISGEAPAQVHVRVRGRSVVLRRVTPGDLAISVDLTSATEGSTLVRITPSQLRLPLSAELVRVSPAEIRLQLVRRAASPTP